MKSQLIEQYLVDDLHQHGLCVVGWFSSPRWDDLNHRKQETMRLEMELEDARKFFNEQAKKLSDNHTHIRAFVLDLSIP